MTDHNSLPYLLISLSTDPDTTWAPIYLAEDQTCLGRPESDQVGAGHIDLDLDSVSRQHALIRRDGTTYTLENMRGRYGIGLFEIELQPGQTHSLRHGYIFRIPALTDHFRILFVGNSKETHLWPLYIEPTTQKVYVFGKLVELPPQEYGLLCYLYTNRNSTCAYNEIIDHIWPGLRERGVIKKGRNLDVLLAKLRRALTAASGGFTFMQTVRGEGIRLVV